MKIYFAANISHSEFIISRIIYPLILKKDTLSFLKCQHDNLSVTPD